MKHLINQVKKELKKHFFDYLLLITAGVFFLIGLNIFKGERIIEFIILLAFSSFYIIWGIYHHLIKDVFRLKIVIEYILIGFIVLFLLKIILIQ
ncbi:MAG: hypothetical protein NZM02_02295 [Patescibacteria group bacterium]|nr:hypothetical protein [Patescibacteria group bacterium]